MNAKERYDSDIRAIHDQFKNYSTPIDTVLSESGEVVQMVENGIPFCTYSIQGPSPDSIYVLNGFFPTSIDIWEILPNEDPTDETIRYTLNRKKVS